MKSKFNKYFVLPIISLTSISLTGCKTNEPENRTENTTVTPTINFHNVNSYGTVLEENGVYSFYLNPGIHSRFVGWTLSQETNEIVSNSETISLENIKELFSSNSNSFDLYAVFEDAITVNFYNENNLESVDLYEVLGNTYTVKNVNKTGYKLSGWSNNQDCSTLDFTDKTTFSYSDIKDLKGTNSSVNLYAVFTANTSNIKNFRYNSNDEMAEIHITTKNGLAIDDASLIDPVKKKGKNGELDVYNYVGATISVTNCEPDYELNNITGKVKVRGNYTSTYDKKPIRIKFDSIQGMLGLNNNNQFKSWVLLAGWKDSSNLRDAVSYFLGNSLLGGDNLYTSDFRFVKLYLNDSYNGVYLLVEQQELNTSRINGPESKNALDDEKTGYLLEFDGYYTNEDALQKFTISYNDVKTGNTGFTIQNDIMNETQYNFIKKFVQNAWKVIYDANKKPHTDLTTSPYHTVDENGDYIIDTSIKSALEACSKVINIESLVDMYIIHEICQDRDIGWSSFYFSLDFSKNGDKKLTFNAPWDFDYALGNNTFENAMLATIKSRTTMCNEGRMTKSGTTYKLKKDTILTKDDFKFTNNNALYCKATDNPWFIVFSSQNWLWEKIAERWAGAKEAKVFDRLLTMVDELSNKYVTEFEENYIKWPQSMGLKLNGYQPDVVTYFATQKQAAQYLRIWLEERINGLNETFSNL